MAKKPATPTTIAARFVETFNAEHNAPPKGEDEDTRFPIGVATAPGLRIALPGVVSTQCATLDAAIGRGGWPMGRISIISGSEAAGKSTLALHACGEAQQRGGLGIYIDAEYKLDLQYAAALGVNTDDLIIAQPPHLEAMMGFIPRAIDMALEVVTDGPIVVVLDSINAARTKREFQLMEEGQDEKAVMAEQARVYSQKLPFIVSKIGKKPVCLLMISQPRQNIASTHGGKNLVAGGGAPKFYAALVVELIRTGFLKESERQVGSMMLGKCVKNQVARPFQEALFNVRWGTGVDQEHALLQRCVDIAQLNTAKGGWYELPDPSDPDADPVKWQGMKGWARIKEKRPDVHEYLMAKVRETWVTK